MARKRLMIFGIPAWLAAIGAALWWRSRGQQAPSVFQPTDETRRDLPAAERTGGPMTTQEAPGDDQPVF